MVQPVGMVERNINYLVDVGGGIWEGEGAMSTGTFSWAPLFSTIIDSSVWRESKETRLVWITILAKKDRGGFVQSALWALARDAGVTEEECREAVRVLESPDPESHNQVEGGRRIRRMDGGWQVINHFYYRDMISRSNQRAKQAAWQKEYRKRKKVGVNEAARQGGSQALQEGLEAVEREEKP
jgi:hypothetical protein